MVNQQHLDILNKGVAIWNEWRELHPEIQPDLSEADLAGENLSGHSFIGGVNLYEAILVGANLEEASLVGAHLGCANLQRANLFGANLSAANLGEADLSKADLREASLFNVYLAFANLSEADLRGADLSTASLVETNLEKADLTGCRIYGISAWDLKLEGAIQSDLIITREDDSVITIDNLEVAQFIYLLIENEKLRDVIDTITSKVVLILGRFTPERKAILEAIKEELRNRNYLPILFDFEKPSSRNLTETLTLLARMARFIIADLTDAKSISHELYAIVPDLPSVPVQPLLEYSQKEYGMFESFSDYPWVLKTYYYDSISEVLASINEKVISPAEAKVRELKKRHHSGKKPN